MNQLIFKQVKYHYPDSGFSLDLDLGIEASGFIVLLGSNGSGKTTLVNLLSGFLHPYSGEIIIDGITVNALKPHERNLSVMFQDNNVIQHLTVRENLEMSLNNSLLSKTTITTRVEDMITTVSLEEYSDIRAEYLSGGQQQRLGFAMCLAYDNDLIVLDEPFSSLDPDTKEQFILLINQFWKKKRITLMLVSHNYLSIRDIATNVVFLDQGRVKFHGSIDDFENSDVTEVKKYLQSINKGII